MIETLSPQEYEQFLSQSGMSYNFMQSSEFVKSHEGREKITIYAGKEDGKILYAVPVLFRPAMKLFTYATSLREWVAADPELLQNEALLKEFVDGVKARLKSDGALIWLVESNVEYQPHDKNGQPVEGIFNNESYREMLERLDFIPSALWTGYDESRQSRWVSWIDLQKNLPQISQGFPISLKADHEMYTWEELLKEMSGNTRRSFQKADLPYLECVITPGDQNPDLAEFDALLEMSAEKHNFHTGSQTNREDLMKAFGNRSYLCTSYLNLERYDEFLQAKEKEFTEKEAQALAVCEKMPNSKKKRNQLLEIQEQKTHNEKEMAALEELKKTSDQTLIPLASGIFFETPSEMVYLFGGSRPDLARYMGPYANQKAMIRLALDHNLRRYNFWGISGNFQPDEDGYGVFYFKKNLGATVGEYCGEFAMIINPLLGKSFLKKIRRGMLEE